QSGNRRAARRHAPHPTTNSAIGTNTAFSVVSIATATPNKRVPPKALWAKSATGRSTYAIHARSERTPTPDIKAQKTRRRMKSALIDRTGCGLAAAQRPRPARRHACKQCATAGLAAALSCVMTHYVDHHSIRVSYMETAHAPR